MTSRSFLICCASILLLSVLGSPFWIGQAMSAASGLLNDTPSAEFANKDFANYWLAGRLTLSGDWLALFHQPSHQRELEEALGVGAMEIRNWSYPPHFLLVTAPLGLLPYNLAYPVFFLATGAVFGIGVYGVATRSSSRPAPAVWQMTILLCLPFVLLQFVTGQNGFLFSGLMLIALTSRRDRPWLSGLALAFLTMKPQLGLLFPLLLLVERNHRAILWTVLFSALLFGASVWLFGWASWVAYLGEGLAYQRLVMTQWDGVFLHMMPTFFAALRQSGLGGNAALAVHLALALPISACVIWKMFKSPPGTVRDFRFILATFVLTPYAFSYDSGALIALLAFLFAGWAHRETEAPVAFTTVLPAAAVFAMPLWTPLPSEFPVWMAWFAPALLVYWALLPGLRRKLVS